MPSRNVGVDMHRRLTGIQEVPMARSDTLRSEIARLQDKRAGYAKIIAGQEKVAARAREAARKKRDQAAKTKSGSQARSYLAAAEREDKKIAAAEQKISKAR